MDCSLIRQKDIFAIPMATKLPMTTIHQGRLLGILYANSKPVIIAEPSLIDVFNFKHYTFELKIQKQHRKEQQ